MFEVIKNIDRRWIFLMMGLAVAIPILFQLRFPEKATGLAKDTFDIIENLEEGDKVLLSFDFDPASEGELGPMATAFVRHCCEKKLKMYFITLWPVGPRMVIDAIDRVIKDEIAPGVLRFPDLVYGEDFVNLGYKSGNEGAIKVIVTNFRLLYTTDAQANAIDDIPMMSDVFSVQDSDLLINISAGYPGTKEWVQYAVTPFPDDIHIVAGCTGVQAPLLYPYIPQQLPGLLGAIKGAAEYESLVIGKYGGDHPDEKYLEGSRRMGPQLIAHVLMVLLIIVGNVIYFMEKKREGSQ